MLTLLNIFGRYFTFITSKLVKVCQSFTATFLPKGRNISKYKRKDIPCITTIASAFVRYVSPCVTRILVLCFRRPFGPITWHANLYSTIQKSAFPQQSRSCSSIQDAAQEMKQAYRRDNTLSKFSTPTSVFNLLYI